MSLSLEVEVKNLQQEPTCKNINFYVHYDLTIMSYAKKSININ